MFDIEKFLESYKNSVTVRNFGETVIIAPPFFHPYCGESIAVKIKVLPDGRPVFSDCGTTVDYLETKYIGVKKYWERINAVMETFNMTLDGREFVMEAPSDSENQVLTAFSSFIEGISVIANIDL